VCPYVLCSLHCLRFKYFVHFRRVRKTAKNDYWLCRVSVCPSLRMQHLGSHWTDLYEIWCFWFSEICLRNSHFIKYEKSSGTLHENLHKYMISRWICLRIKNFSDKSCRENKKIMLSKFSRKSWLFYTMWKNIVEKGIPHIRIWHMPITCWIPKATNPHSEYAILIAFPLHLNITLYVHCLSWYYSYVLSPAYQEFELNRCSK
jgi:hypothetical protein